MKELIYKAIVVQKDPMLTNIINLYSEKTNLIEVKASFSNAKDAFSYLEENSVDLIFIDNYLLGISGEKIVKYMKTKVKSKAEIIVLSGEASCNIVKNLFNNGIVDYLIIPFSYTRFKSSIQNNIYKIGTKEYEYGGSGLATKEYGESTIDTFNGISFTQIIDGKLYFRYGARGSGQNEWYNNDLYVQIIYYSSC